MSSIDIAFVYLAVLALVFVRWIVWRRRYKGLLARADGLARRLAEVERNLARLQDAAAPAEVPAAARDETAAVAAVEEPAAKAETLAAPPPMAPAAAAEARPGPWTRQPEAPAAVREPTPAPAAAPAFAKQGWARLRGAVSKQAATADWETTIGGTWLNKIGVVVLVIGVALFLGYSLQYMGPIGRVATGGAVGVALLGLGVRLEGTKAYRLFARPLTGGGWALLYFTAYAAHNIAATKVIDSPVAAAAALLAVAAGMIAHALKYASPVATGFAYGLGFLAIAISPFNAFSLGGTAVLAASLVGILWRRPWPGLALFGVAATYVTHFLWASASAPEAVLSAASFWTSQGALIFYWLLFVTLDFRPPPASVQDERLGLAASLGNTAAFAGLSALQVSALFPDALYVLAGGGSAAYAVTGALLARYGRRTLYVLHGLTAALLLAAACALALEPLRLARDWLAAAWLIEGVGVLALGLRGRETAFRHAGYVLAAAALLAAIAHNVFGPHPDAASQWLRWITVGPLIAYLLALRSIQRAVARAGLPPSETEIAVAAGYAGTGLLAALLWQELRPDLVGLAWLAAGLAFCEAGLRRAHRHLRNQGYLLCGADVAALFTINLYEVYAATGTAISRPAAVGPAVFGLFFLYGRLRRLGAPAGLTAGERGRIDWAAHAATALLAVLAWKELDPVAVAVAWGILALLLYEAGSRLGESRLRLQAHLLAGLAFGRLFLANFVAIGDAVGLSLRLVTVTPVVALLYHQGFATKDALARGAAAAWERHLPRLYGYAAAVGLVALARFELGRAHAVMAWAALALIFLALGVIGRDRDFRLQAYALGLLAFWRSWTTNFYLTGSFYGLPERIATTVPVIVALFALALLWRSRRAALHEATRAGRRDPVAWFDANSRMLFSVLATVLLAALLFYTVEGNLLTIAWAIQGLAVMTAGFLAQERSLRLAGLGLLGACLLKVFVIDLQGVETLYRIFSFIVLGLILLVVSFAYTKYRDLIRRYL